MLKDESAREKIGARVREAVEAYRRPQIDLAAECEVSPQAITGWFKGKISPKSAARLAELTGFNVSYLLGLVDSPKHTLSTGLPPAASQPMRSTGRTLAIAAGALTRFLARRDMQLDVTKETDAELLLAVVAEYEASRNDPDADTAFVVALADLVQAYEAKRNGGDGRGSEQAVGAA